jgi:tetrahydromethanopterin S-methyltransferase subunit G
MCSCKTQKLDSNVKERNDIRSDLSYLNESVKISTQNHAYFANDTQRIVIEEDIVVTEYDKETGKPTKETKTKRKTTQDSDKVVAEEENQAVTDCNQLKVDHSADVSKKIDSEVKEESIGGQESFGKWFGIVFGVIVGILLLYLLRKLRVN